MRMFIWLILFGIMSCFNADARTTFLPDWQGGDIGVRNLDEDASYDENMCRRAGIYHKASGCSAPKIFDEYCPFDADWISECYCPSIFSEDCVAPYKGDVRKTDNEGYSSCDGLWIECCDTTCPSGTSVDNTPGCDGSAGTNACGETCYYPYRAPLADETDCQWGTEDCSDDCGGTRQCCKPCPEEPDVDASTCSYGTTTCTDQCGKTYTCCASCTPADDVDASTCSYGTTTCTDHCGESYVCCADCTPANDVDASTCANGTTTCTDQCGEEYVCCADCTPTLTAVAASTCSYGTKQVDNGCGTNVTRCKTCADNGGTEGCTGQTTACGTNQSEKSSCTDCNGTKRYTCEDKEEPANNDPTCADAGYQESVPDGYICTEVKSGDLTCYDNCLASSTCGTGYVPIGDTMAYDTAGDEIAILYNGAYYTPKAFSCGGRSYSDTLENIANNSQYILPPYTLNTSIQKIISVSSYWTSTQCGSTSHITGTGSCSSDTTMLSCSVGLMSCGDTCAYKGRWDSCDGVDTSKYTCTKEECSGKYIIGCNTSYYNVSRSSAANTATCSEEGACAEVCAYDGRYYRCSADFCEVEEEATDTSRTFTLYYHHSMPWGSCSPNEFGNYNFWVGFYDSTGSTLISQAGVTVYSGGTTTSSPIIATFSAPIANGTYKVYMQGNWSSSGACSIVSTTSININGTSFDSVPTSGVTVNIVPQNVPSVVLYNTFGSY